MIGAVARPLFTAEDRLCVLLSYTNPDPGEVEQMHAIACRVGSWEALWTLADANASAPLTFYNLRAAALLESVPAAVRERFADRAADVQSENDARLRAARGVLAALVARALPVAVLKGAFLGEAVYRNPHYKRMNDLDLLVRREDVDAVYAVYDACGLRHVGARRVENRTRTTHHAPPHVTADLACVIDTQWALATPLRGYALDDTRIWSRTEDFPLDVPLRTLCPEDHLHHLCIHLGWFKTAIGDLADIYNLLRRYRAVLRWDLFLDEVARAGTEDAVYHALRLADRLCPMLETQELLRRLAPAVSLRARRGGRVKTERLARLIRLGSDHLETVQRQLAELAASPSPREARTAFRSLWQSVLLPPPEDASKMAVRPGARGLVLLQARVLAPWRVLRAFAADVGAWRLVLLAFGSCIALLRPWRAGRGAARRDGELGAADLHRLRTRWSGGARET